MLVGVLAVYWVIAWVLVGCGGVLVFVLGFWGRAGVVAGVLECWVLAGVLVGGTRMLAMVLGC